MRHIDFTSGPVGKKILLFSLPLMVGNVFQQLYNVVDTLVVGKFLGEAPLAAVGSAYTLMIFLTDGHHERCCLPPSGRAHFLHAGAFRGHSLYPGLFMVDIGRAFGGVSL